MHTAHAHENALDALGDPTRRRVLELLRGGPLPVGEVAAQLPVSRPAVSKHLKVLGRAGLVTHVRVGTRSLYRIDARGLEAVRAYVDGFWTDVLTAFADHVEATHPPRPERSGEASASNARSIPAPSLEEER